VLLVLAVQTLLASPDLTPAYAEINAFDEAKYIESGRLLLEGELRELTWGPLVALAYAPFHLVFRNSPDWFVIEAWTGRILLFMAMWLSTYHLSLQFASAAHKHVTIGVLFVSTAFFDVLKNPSDALLVTFSALALARVIAFVDRKREIDLGLASLFVGLAVLSRFEAVLLIPVMLLTLLLLRRSLISVPRSLLAGLLPVAALLGAYLLTFRLSAPGSDLGIGSKSYDSFEVNQPLPGEGTRNDRRELARSLFGTSEQNRGSVLRAVLRNPAAFAARLLATLRLLPDLFLSTFGKKLGPAILLFSLWGAYALLRSGKSIHLGILALWAAVSFVALAFLPLHVARQLSGLIMVLGSLGITAALGEARTNLGRRLPLAAGLLLTTYGLVDGKLAFTVVGVVLAVAFVLIRLTSPQRRAQAATDLRGAALLLAAGLILRGPYSFPNYPPIGGSPEEQVVHYLQGALPRGARILESLPLPAVAAGMAEVSWGDDTRSLSTSEELQAWLTSQEIDAVFVDGRDIPRPGLVDLLAAGTGTHFRLGYESEDGRLRVFLVQAEGSD
jgi:hypothetical protein